MSFFILQPGLTRKLRALTALLPCLLALNSATTLYAQKPIISPRPSVSSVPRDILLRVVRAEDERRWDTDLNSLLSDKSPSVRERAALAAGRIGDEREVPALISLLQKDQDEGVRAMAAFALGETESANAADPLVADLSRSEGKLRARIVEALGKIGAPLPKDGEASRSLGAAILSLLNSEHQSRSSSNQSILVIALTAALRVRPEGAGKVVAQFLTHSDPRVRADAANTLARLRAKEGNEQLRKLLLSDADPIVRANAARVLGATEDKEAFDSLLDRALKDTDSRVRVSAIRSLAALKDQRAAEGFRVRIAKLMAPNLSSPQAERNEILEVAVMLGRVLQGTANKDALAWLSRMRESFNNSAPEVEIAFERISPQQYLAELGAGAAAKRKAQETLLLNWNAGSSLAQGLAAIAALPDSSIDKAQLAEQAQEILRAMLEYRKSGITINTGGTVRSDYAVPDVLRALAAFKPQDLNNVLIAHLEETDVIVRATAAEQLGELPPDEATKSALIKAWSLSQPDKLNDASLAILDSLAKQKSAAANDVIKTALGSTDYLIRRSAAALLKENGAGDFSARIGIMPRNTQADYERAVSRIGKDLRAIVSTTQGAFTIELLPEHAPLNVDNFVELAKRGYFKGISFHRVVPNFVIQGGDPRGDGNGGPGYAVRCEINQVPYERGVVGMALSGKDTGGSQWFVTHSPQPHLDGGYTVFGRVTSGMDVVDRIARGDVIRSVVVTEGRRRASRR